MRIRQTSQETPTSTPPPLDVILDQLCYLGLTSALNLAALLENKRPQGTWQLMRVSGGSEPDRGYSG